MAVKRITTQSLPSRLGKSISGVLGGIALALLAVVLLFWNEGRAVSTARGLAEGEANVIELASADTVDQASHGKLVHISGMLSSDEVLRDEVFGMEVPALKLRRTVEMLQWREKSESQTRTKLGGGTETVTTYSHEKTWSESLIDSSRFEVQEGHANPGGKPIESQELVASNIFLGAYRLGDGLVARVNRYEELPAPEELPDGHITQGNVIFRSADINAPQIGDLRITFKAAMPAEVSIVARNNHGVLDGFRTKSDSTIQMLHFGRENAEAMFRNAKSANKSLTFGLRMLGFILLFIGVKSVLGPVAVVADVLPFVGRVTRAGTTILAALVALPAAFITIAIAWLTYRPLIGVSLIIVALAVGFGIFRMARRFSAKRAATAP